MKGRILGVFALVFAVSLAPPEAEAQGKWIELAPFPEPAEELYGVAAGGKLYVSATVSTW